MREQTGPRPSARAAERLAIAVGDEVADLRGALRRALDEADRLQAAGRPDLAADVLEEQRATLALVHEHLTARLAAAAVEREAEGVVAASTAPSVAADPSPVAVVRAPRGGEGTALRLLASAVAAIAGAALLLAPDVGGGALQTAGWGTAVDESAPAADEAFERSDRDPAVSIDDTTAPSAAAGSATPTDEVAGTAPTTPAHQPVPYPDDPHRPSPADLPGAGVVRGVLDSLPDADGPAAPPTGEDLERVDVGEPQDGEQADSER